MFGNIDAKVRPIKLAHLVDPDNAEQVRNAIRLSSTLWGGMHFPILPLYKRMPTTWRDEPLGPPPAKTVIQGYLDAFDPDFLVQFSATVPDFITKAGLEIVRPEQIWQGLGRDSPSPRFGIGIFELLSDVFDEYFKYKLKYPVKMLFPKIPDAFSLFWSSMFGELTPSVASEIERRYADALEIRSIDFSIENLTEVMSHDVLFPRRITQWQLNSFRHSGFRSDARVYFLDATKVGDIIDFWNLRAINGQVVPLPKQLKDDPQLRELLITFLKANSRPWKHNPKVFDFASIIRARSSTLDEMEEYAKSLKIERDPTDPPERSFFSLQHWYPRIWDEWAREKDGAVPDDQFAEESISVEVADTNKLSIQFKPTLPKFAFKHIQHDKPRCANELTFRLYGPSEYLAQVFPKSSGENFNRAISGLLSFEKEWRVGRHGLVKFVGDDFAESRDIPAAETIMFAWLRDKGWSPILSPPGLLAKEIFKRLEGYLGILHNPRLLGMLEFMNGGRAKQDGTAVEKPAETNEIEQDRDLSVGEIKTRLASPAGGEDLYQNLLAKGIFKLGLRVQCPHCIRRSWFALQNVQDSFACPRCLNSFPAAGNIDTGTWSYKTAGPFSVPKYADGAYAVLLTLDLFHDRKMATMQTTPVVSFSAKGSDNKKLEADFALFWQESLYGEKRTGVMFGECKTYGLFERKDFDRMRYLAKSFPGAVLAFSTLRKSLTPKETTEIARIAKRGRKYWKTDHPINPVLVLTGTELFHWHGPPSCWDEPVRKRFDHARGLLALCDATQQLYLNMPSWHVEWEKKWQDRRRRQQKSVTSIMPVALSKN